MARLLSARYALANVRVRGSRAALTGLSVSLVVAVFCYLLCFADGLRGALAHSGDDRNLIVLAEPATAESNSALWQDQLQKLKGLPQAALDSHGRPLVSPEVVVQTGVTRRGDDSAASATIAVRGIDPEPALLIHTDVQLVAGRWFAPGADELVVGLAAARQFSEGALGATLTCGERSFTVVGLFSARGGVHESEFWGYSSNIADAYRRTLFSSAVVRLQSADAACVAEASQRIAAAGIALRAVAEPAYFAGQTQSARALEVLALILVVIMGSGAVFAAMNTMYSAVAGRTREIGTLRALGFSRARVMLVILGESLTIALGGGVLGCLACAAYIRLDGGARDLVGTATFTSVAFTVVLTGLNVGRSLAIAALVGLFGGFWPARAACRLSIVRALRIA